jgi:hypothetical protein
MPAQGLFGISVAFGFVAWGIVVAQYFWPLLRAQARVDALHPLLLLHSFRFVGLAFLVKGVVAPELPAAFAVPSRIWRSHCGGAGLACWLLCAARSASPWSGFSTFGAVPIFSTPSIKAMLTGYVASHVLHSAFIVPLLLITHALVFLILLRRDTVAAAYEVTSG